MGLIKYCGIDGGNFGDDINLQLWHRLFPDLSRLQGQVLFYGVGTLLDGPHDTHTKKVVLGTGIGEAGAARRDGNWDFRWVRGPLTAAEFGLDKGCAIGDSAILWPGLTRGHNPHGPIGLVPHYATWDSYDWMQVGADAGMLTINPRQAPEIVMAQMRGCSRILAESLHGAICADAMGIPWAACILAHRFNEFKWRDWLATINRPYAPLVADRPLVRDIGWVKARANRMARWVQYKRYTRHPALRPVAASTYGDAQAVAAQLRRYANQDAHFACSTARLIDAQRARMHTLCAEFAKEYQIAFCSS